jgi:hypothetical protein
MATEDSGPLDGQPGRTEPDQAGDGARTGSEPGDEYFTSGSFSPVAVQVGDDPESESEGPEEDPRPVADPGEDSPQVIVQLGEDPGVV